MCVEGGVGNDLGGGERHRPPLHTHMEPQPYWVSGFVVGARRMPTVDGGVEVGRGSRGARGRGTARIPLARMTILKIRSTPKTRGKFKLYLVSAPYLQGVRSSLSSLSLFFINTYIFHPNSAGHQIDTRYLFAWNRSSRHTPFPFSTVESASRWKSEHLAPTSQIPNTI